MSLTGKVALITGASSGIGAATAVLLSSLGAKLSLTGRNAENLQKVSSREFLKHMRLLLLVSYISCFFSFSGR